MDTKPNHCNLSYLIRLWRVGKQRTTALRVQLINPHTKERWSFESIKVMARFLEDEVGKEDERVIGEKPEKQEHRD